LWSLGSCAWPGRLDMVQAPSTSTLPLRCTSIAFGCRPQSFEDTDKGRPTSNRCCSERALMTRNKERSMTKNVVLSIVYAAIGALNTTMTRTVDGAHLAHEHRPVTPPLSHLSRYAALRAEDPTARRGLRLRI